MSVPQPIAKGSSASSIELVTVPVAASTASPLSLSTKKTSAVVPIGLAFEDLTYKITTKDKTQKALIDGATGRVQPGRLTAIMGASGAGKTTFMNLLAGRITPSKEREVTGSVRINGEESKHIQRISGYVLQEDVLLPHLTPREHLEFAAKMQLPTTTIPEEVQQRVDHVLKLLRLNGCANTRVGNPLLKRGISGGERKRTAVGIELVADPQLLFLDEPTSGLDSDTAASLVDILHTLAGDGHTILCTIHQPSSDMFAQFDDLLLLASGRIIYNGPANGAVAHFAALGHHCGPQVNPAEFLLTLLHNTQQASASPEAGHVTVDQLARARGKIVSDLAWEKSFPKVSTKREKIGVMQQLGLLLGRSWKMVIRDPQATVMKFAQYVFVTIFASLLFLRLDDSGRGIQSKAGNVFSVLLLFSFMPAQGIILLFPNERPVFLREYSKGLYHPFVYFLANNLAQLPFQIAFPLICAAINYWVVGLRATAGHFFAFALVAVITFMIGASIGLLVGAALADVGRGMELGPTLIIPQMLVAGLFVATKSMPVWLRWLQYVSFVHWGWNANMQNEFLDRAVKCSDRAVNCSGNDLLEFYDLYDTSYGLAIGVLIAMLIVYRFIGYVLLHLSAHRAKGSN